MKPGRVSGSCRGRSPRPFGLDGDVAGGGDDGGRCAHGRRGERGGCRRAGVHRLARESRFWLRRLERGRSQQPAVRGRGVAHPPAEPGRGRGPDRRTRTRATAPSSAIRSGRRTDGQASAVATSGSPTPIMTGTRGRRRSSAHATRARGRIRVCCSSATRASRSRRQPRTSGCGTGPPSRSPKPVTSCCTPPSVATVRRGRSTPPISSRQRPRRLLRAGSSIPGTESWIAAGWRSSVIPAPPASRSTSATPIHATRRSWPGIRPLPSPSRA